MGRLAFLLPRFPRREAHAMGSTGTHSGRPRMMAPASCPPSEPFWPLSSPLLTTATHSLPSGRPTLASGHDPEHGKRPRSIHKAKILICVRSPVPAGIKH